MCNKCSKNILEEPNERIAKLESLINKKESTLNKVLNNLDQNEKIISDLKKVSESKEKINKSLQKKICQIKKEHANHLSNLNQKIPNFKIEQQITELSVIKAESIVNQDELNQRISANLDDLNNYKDLVNDLTKKLQSSENERETEKNKEVEFKKILADAEDSRSKMEQSLNVLQEKLNQNERELDQMKEKLNLDTKACDTESETESENKNYKIIPAKKILTFKNIKCQTEGCNGLGNTRPNFKSHSTVLYCPIAAVKSKSVTRKELDVSVDKHNAKKEQEKVFNEQNEKIKGLEKALNDEKAKKCSDQIINEQDKISKVIF